MPRWVRASGEPVQPESEPLPKLVSFMNKGEIIIVDWEVKCRFFIIIIYLKNNETIVI